MLKIGKFNKLKIIRQYAKDIYLDGGDSVEVVLVKTDAPRQCNIGDELNVFVYGDLKEGFQATLQIPFAQVDDVAWLKVKEVNDTGAFLDWGLAKDLLLPYGEQTQKSGCRAFVSG
jgi:Uncharacterized protein conserved in bacteria